ncbi:MarR family winged helix-turn-helix transcriptional regulator [Mangrovihabitans endophyticus]|uniref:MarR family transcriptional regulator n=1 Tax=Mangrovihabitans endophyticus TaxID=1751298 RepID=A0A8J3C0F3_9ACTN|nr:MarR family transcriptional regulator [Mangrovihabitans endophyticus]GGK99824.1 MarR family transcriptional regulator [Mangrovihabitans endophyticus]
MPATEDTQRTVSALMMASRAFVGITARSLAGIDADVTLPQFRALMVLAMRGPQRPADISAELKVAPSTGTRMCDRLVRKQLLRRTRTPSDRRVVRLRLTPAGRELVEQVVRARREELTAIVAATAEHWGPPVTAALQAFAEASGELPEQDWWLGWADGEESEIAV